MKKQVRKTLTIILTAVFLISTFMVIWSAIEKKQEQNSLDSAIQLAFGTASEAVQAASPEGDVGQTSADRETGQESGRDADTEDSEPMDAVMYELAMLDIAALQAVNPEVIGWIRIPDTDINHPLTQGSDNQFYLNHTWDLQSNRHGSIFMEHSNSPGLTDHHTIIYGHKMLDGTMFADLLNYDSLEYLQAHPYIYVRTESGVYRYEIYSTYSPGMDTPSFALQLNLDSDKQTFLQMTLDCSEFVTGITPTWDEPILTLSTCSPMGMYYRKIVHSRLDLCAEITVTADFPTVTEELS